MKSNAKGSRYKETVAFGIQLSHKLFAEFHLRVIHAIIFVVFKLHFHDFIDIFQIVNNALLGRVKEGVLMMYQVIHCTIT
jgi:hypothetical protein